MELSQHIALQLTVVLLTGKVIACISFLQTRHYAQNECKPSAEAVKRYLSKWNDASLSDILRSKHFEQGCFVVGDNIIAIHRYSSEVEVRFNNAVRSYKVY